MGAWSRWDPRALPLSSGPKYPLKRPESTLGPRIRSKPRWRHQSREGEARAASCVFIGSAEGQEVERQRGKMKGAIAGVVRGAEDLFGEGDSKIWGKAQGRRCRAGLGGEIDGERQKWTEIKGRKRWSELEEGRCKEPRERENLLGWRESLRGRGRRREPARSRETRSWEDGERERDLGSAWVPQNQVASALWRSRARRKR